MGHARRLFLYFHNFWRKKYLRAFREIDWALSTLTIINQFGWNFQKLFSYLRDNIILINLNDILCYHHVGAVPQNSFICFKILLFDIFGNYKLISTKFSEISVLSEEWQFRPKNFLIYYPFLTHYCKLACSDSTRLRNLRSVLTHYQVHQKITKYS